jgi:hypothetical protein
MIDINGLDAWGINIVFKFLLCPIWDVFSPYCRKSYYPNGAIGHSSVRDANMPASCLVGDHIASLSFRPHFCDATNISVVRAPLVRLSAYW